MTQAAVLQFTAILGLFSCSPAKPTLAPVTNAYTIENDHWIWLKRLAKNDFDFQPDSERHDISDFGMVIFSDTGTQAYESCGITFHDGEQVFYGAATTQMLIRARPTTHAQIEALHKRIDALRK